MLCEAEALGVRADGPAGAYFIQSDITLRGLAKASIPFAINRLASSQYLAMRKFVLPGHAVLQP